MVPALVDQQKDLHEDALRRVEAKRKRSHEAGGKGVQSILRVGYYSLVARPFKVNKLVGTWTRPCGLVEADDHVCAVDKTW